MWNKVMMPEKVKEDISDRIKAGSLMRKFFSTSLKEAYDSQIQMSKTYETWEKLRQEYLWKNYISS